MSHGSAAKAAREAKERHPELYCPVGRCLWRTGGGRCPKHPGTIAQELAEMEARDPKLKALGERIENFGRAIAANQTANTAPTHPEACPTCSAAPGSPCVWLGTTSIPRFVLHQARRAGAVL